MTADALTRPERGCARHQARDVSTAVREDGGCAYCTRRLDLFKTVGRRALCGLPTPKQFPACVEDPQGFDFDEPAFREGAGRNLNLRGTA